MIVAEGVRMRRMPVSRGRPSSLLVALALAAGAAACGAEPVGVGGDAEPAELQTRIEAGTAPFVLDVRTPEEFAGGHVPGAVNIPHDQLAARVGELTAQREAELVVYCERGGRAERATEALAAAGFTGVRHLKGDMSGWRDEGRPTE